MSDSPWLLVPEVVTYARSSKTEVLAALADGSLAGKQLRPGGKWRVHRDAVDAWLAGEPYVPETPRLIRGRAS